MRNDTNEKPFRPLVYICSPFSGDVEGNMERTRQFCRFALEHGQIPLAPHLMFPQFVNTKTRRKGISLCSWTLSCRANARSCGFSAT